MDARVKRFREEVAGYGSSGVGRRYSASLRAAAVALAQERRDEPLSRVAADLGVSPLSLQRWCEQGEPGRFRPVAIESEPVGLPLGGLVLITPQGYRVMGLEAASLVSLLRALG
jgi:Transposase